MEYVVYIDIIFLTDLFMDFLALLLTAAFVRRHPSVIRLILAAAVGSGWTCFLILCPGFSEAAELLITIVGVGSLMNWIAFYCDLPKDFIRHFLHANASLLISSAVLNGCLSFIRERMYLSDWESLVFLGAMSGAIVIFLTEMLKKQKVGTERYSVRLYYNGQEREFTGFADSGNRLCVPESGKPVSLVSYRDCIGFCDKVSGGLFIPYRAVGTEHGLLFAITFEKMEIRKSGTCIKIEDPVVAITKEPLSTGGDFNMILPEEYVMNTENRVFRKYQTQQPKEEIK